MRKISLLAMLLAALPAAAYDVNGVGLGARESEVKKRFPSIHCKELEWKSLAAERRCDDSKVAFGGAEVRITLYLRKDAVQAFDVRFDAKDTERVAAFAKARYRAPDLQAAVGKGRRARRARRAAGQEARHAQRVARQFRRGDLPGAVALRRLFSPPRRLS